jgi:lysozyme
MDLNKLHTQLNSEEGLRLMPYRDSVGKITIGRGHNLSDDGISLHIAEEIYLEDVTRAISIATQYVPAWPTLDDVRQRVFVDLAFNMQHKLGTFGVMLTAANRRDFGAAADALQSSLWYTEVGMRGSKLVSMLRTGADPS